jgi:hypothetical protein
MTFNYKAYTAVGSRNTPLHFAPLMKAMAEKLAADGWTMRSGHAPGADQFFEEGAGTWAEIYVAWDSFEKQVPILGRKIIPSGKTLDLAILMASTIHERWDLCSPAARLLHARNMCQVWGADLAVKSHMLVCWAPPTSNGVQGGTNLAWQAAKLAGIPCYNLAIPEHEARIRDFVAKPVHQYS